MEPNFHIKFDQCPNCKSELRFLEELGKEMKDRGLARAEWNMRYDQRTGAVADDARSVLMPIGIKTPGYHTVTDICMDCGIVYAVELRRIEGTTSAAPPSTKIPPNTGGSQFPIK